MNFTLEEYIRLTEILLGLSFVQQSVEHLFSSFYERRIFLLRLVLSLLLIIGIQSSVVSVALLLLSMITLCYFQGPYNGGSDRMSLLILCCLVIAKLSPTKQWQELAFGYLAIQLLLSYFIAGWVKVINPEWRSGRALQDVFQFSAYPVSEGLRDWVKSPKVFLSMSWCVIFLELLFPISLYSSITLTIALALTATFHFSNACLFGFNRFFWIWLTAYPSIIWFQQRIFS